MYHFHTSYPHTQYRAFFLILLSYCSANLLYEQKAFVRSARREDNAVSVCVCAGGQTNQSTFSHSPSLLWISWDAPSKSKCHGSSAVRYPFPSGRPTRLATTPYIGTVSLRCACMWLDVETVLLTWIAIWGSPNKLGVTWAHSPCAVILWFHRINGFLQIGCDAIMSLKELENRILVAAWIILIWRMFTVAQILHNGSPTITNSTCGTC